MPEYKDDPAFTLNSNGGVYPNPGAKLDDPADFEKWDWKMIRAAVVGFASAPEDQQRPAPESDPNTLWEAATTFHRTQALFKYLSQNISLQAEALAGPDGAWKGKAADSFRAMMDSFAAKLQAKGDQIAGGPSGTNSMAVQFHDSGNHLKWAQDSIRAIDSYYANWVLAQPGGRLPNGLAYVSKFKGLPEQMGDDMKKVVRILAAKYVDTYDTVVVPDTSGFDTPSIPEAPKLPGMKEGPPSSVDRGVYERNTPKGVQAPDLPPPPGGVGGPYTATGILSPGKVLSPGSDMPPALDDVDGPSLTDNKFPNPGGLPAGMDLPPSPGGVGGPYTAAGILSPGKVLSPGGAGPSDTQRGMTIENPPAVVIGKQPGSGGLGLNLDRHGAGAPMTPSLVRPAAWAAPADLAGPRMSGAPMTPPMMPPMGGPQGGGAERPDASGLLGGETKPWQGGLPPPVGDPIGTNPPLMKPEAWAASDFGPGAGLAGPGMGGAPMLPPMGGGAGGGAGGGGGGGAERPDSAGLLGGEVEPWQGGGVPLSVSDPSGANLPVVKPEEWALSPDGVVGPQLSGAPMMPPPMMPPMGGSQGGGAERPDSAGLLGSEEALWAPQKVTSDIDAAGSAPDVAPANWAVSLAADRQTTLSSPVDTGVLEPVESTAEQSAMGDTGPSEPALGSAVVEPDTDLATAALPEGWSTFSEVGVSPRETVAPGTEAVVREPVGTASESSARVAESVVAGQEAFTSAQVAGAAVIGASALGIAGVAAAAHIPPAAPAAAASTSLGPPRPESPNTWAGAADHREDKGAGPLGLQGGDTSALSEPTPGVTGIDSVVVVRAPEAVEDTSAWDDDSFLLLPKLLPIANPALREGVMGVGGEFAVADHALRSTELWQSESGEPHTTYRRRKAGEVDPIVEDNVVGLCGDESSLPVDEREKFLADMEKLEEEAEAEEDEDEENSEQDAEERVMADLLNQDGSAWGSRSTKPTGILE